MRLLCHCFVNLGFPHNTNFANKYKFTYGEKKEGMQIFSKIVRASKLTRQRTLQINNVHLDHGHC